MRSRLLPLDLVFVIVLGTVAPAVAAGDAELNPLSKVDPAVFKSFADRPLFAPSRRKPDIPERNDLNEATEAEDSFNIKLVGIAITPDGASARILDVSDDSMHTLNSGDIFNTWAVVAITNNALVMSKDGEKKTYTLFAVNDKDDVNTSSPRKQDEDSLNKENDPCSGNTDNCGRGDREKQDLIDFFGEKAK